jgi:HlyD family type I secretion membrane fusion protein
MTKKQMNELENKPSPQGAEVEKNVVKTNTDNKTSVVKNLQNMVGKVNKDDIKDAIHKTKEWAKPQGKMIMNKATEFAKKHEDKFEIIKPYYVKLKNWVLYQWAVFENYEWVIQIKRFLFSDSVEGSGYHSTNSITVKDAIKPYISLFKYSMFIFAAFFVLWGGIAPLDSAAIAEGTITLLGSSKVIQHDHGGIIKKITVSDGEVVKENQILLEIDDTQVMADLQRIKSNLLMQRAIKQRIIAEQSKADKIDWNIPDFDVNNPEVKEIIETQNNLFTTRVAIYHASKQIKLDQIKMKTEEIQTLEARQEANSTTLKTLETEVRDLQKLNAKGLVQRGRLYEMQRQLDQAYATKVEITTLTANSYQAIKSLELEVLNIENEYLTRLSNDYNDNQAQILDLNEKFNAQAFTAERSVVRAPVSGIVTALNYHTVGGFVTPGARIMEIIPQDDKLIVEAKVRTQDIDAIYPGLLARVQLAAYKQRIVPRLDGKVIYVSADKIIEERTGMHYYIAKVEIDEDQLAKVNTEIKLYPGMPASVFIVKGERTFLNYMISPIIDSFHRAFKEQ